jgi:uncharacterized integral membrane protein
MNEPVSTNSGDSNSSANLFKVISLMVIALLLVIFAIQNSHEVIINLWFWGFRTSLALALIICLAGGFLLSLIYFIPLLRNKHKSRRTGKNQGSSNLDSRNDPFAKPGY